ncbi:MAG: hypothetical protein EPN25_07005 [Nitrospirae bacterium]|nr:MAG: hypothetical protein EPN25_07005 [Nitrospirota bacterium]
MTGERTASEGHNSQPSHSTPFILFLMATAVLCGALVMVIEIMGSRVIGPCYGVSLFVWTALITVTLVALAAGYAAGGMLSDRHGSPDYLYGIIFIAGCLVLIIPLIKAMVLKQFLFLGLRSGALLSALLLFGPSLFLLGCVSPYIIKIAVREMSNIGRTVGVFYAISTVGSFLGTVATGFFLIAYAGVNRIFAGIGILLVVLAVSYFVFFRKRWAVLLLLLLPAVMPQAELLRTKDLPNGTRVEEVFRKEGFYGMLKVLDYTYGKVHTRELMIDGLIQGGIDMKDKLPVYEFFYFMEFLPYSLNPGGATCLVIGVGGGVVPVWYEQRGIRTDVVDINPDIISIARDYFGFRVSGDVFIEDARYYLGRTKKQYDYIVLDVFNGDTTPGHILSLEALQLLRLRMTPKGVVAINVAGSLRQETFMTASVVRTLQQVFETVEVYPLFSPVEGDGFGNLAIIAYNYPRAEPDPGLTSKFPVHPMAREGVTKYIGRTFSFPPDTPAIVLTDDYNPIDFYDVWLKEKIRKDILANNPLDILI